MKAIREVRMRRVVFAEIIDATDADTIVRQIHELLEVSANHPRPAYTATLDALSGALAKPGLVHYDNRAEIYAVARNVGHDEVARLFFDMSPTRASARDAESSMEPERALVPKGRTLTLGERKSAARGHRPEMLMHLLRDPHPDVVGVLLENPHLTERDVIAIAARRPSIPESLSAVATSRRWSVRYNVKRALAMNPYTPAHVALRIVTTLRTADLVAIRNDRNLPTSLRMQATELLQLR
jgi:hypothetical protein